MPTKQKLLHFDAIDGVENYDRVFSNRQNGSGQNVTGSQSYNTRLGIATQINNLKCISLKRVEIPFLAQNVRSTNASNYIKFYGSTYGAGVEFGGEIMLQDRNYTSITTLLADLNTAFAAKIATFVGVSGLSITFYVNPQDASKIVIKSNVLQSGGGFNIGNLKFEGSILTRNILGMAFQSHANPDFMMSNADTYSYMYLTNCYNLQPDNYFNLNFTNIETSPTNANGRPTTFKIPMSGSFGEVIYYSESDGSEQKAFIDRPNTSLTYLNMVITDRWGFPVYGFGSQISFTLNIEYDDIM